MGRILDHLVLRGGATENEGGDLFRGANQGKYRAFRLDSVEAGRHACPLITTTLSETAFWSVREFRRDTETELPVILLVPPLSGQLPILLRDMLLGLVQDFRVVVLDWANVRHVPPSFGAFGFDDNIRVIADAIRCLGPGISVVALCQSGIPALAACADLALATPGAEPASLVLIAAPIDPMANPTPVVDLIRSRSAHWYRVVPIGRVGHRFPGWRREVYPAETQLRALSAYLVRQMAGNTEIARKVKRDDGADPAQFPFLDLYTSIMDIDARHFAENIETVFLRRGLVEGSLCVDGRSIEPGALRRTALLTIEGAQDNVAAPGQTSAALALCTGLSRKRKRRIVVPDCGHYSLFHGATWRRDVLPLVRDHCLSHVGAGGGRDAGGPGASGL